MAKKKQTKKQVEEFQFWTSFSDLMKSEVTHFIVGLMILLFTVFATLSMISFFFTGSSDQSKIEGISLFYIGNIANIQNWTGFRGACLSNILMNEWFGISTFILLYFFARIGLRLMHVKPYSILTNFVFSALSMIGLSIAVSFFLGYFFRDSAIYIGGKHGFIMSDILKENLGIPGTAILLILFFVVVMVFVNADTIPFLRKFFNIKPLSFNALWTKKATSLLSKKDEEDQNQDPEVIVKYKKDATPNILVVDQKDGENAFVRIEDVKSDADKAFEVHAPVDEEYYIPTEEAAEDKLPLIINKSESDELANELLREHGLYDPTIDLPNFKFPGLELLKKYDLGDRQVDMDEQNANKNRIITTLEHYGIKIKSIKATVGPTITLYEIIPEDGVRISKIRNLEDDIAMSLSALGIRIIAPMPGKGTIGIEVPNKDPQIVSMHSIIASKKFQESKLDLPIALGKTITNEVFMVDLCKMPHLLVAGATGQGKSVGLNAAITSLLYKKHPAELKFVLVDPKMVEFSIYSIIEKHYLAKLPDSDKPIITDFTKVIYTLNSLTKEMDDRYDLLMKAGSRNIKEYNEKFFNRRLNPLKGHKFMPYIVVIIDEFGDLIMTAGKEIELPIARIAQKARAVGIHMIIATQRPTTNIITGTIKANFPARIAFRVTSMIDSRTILDSPGANQLIGRGDLLFFQGSDMTRVQCAFVDTPEVERISEFIGSQAAYPTAFYLPEYVGEDTEKSPGGVDLRDRDALFDDAARLIVIHQQGSTSLIQRKFSVGYNRAARIMDQLEAARIVGPFEGSKARQVLIQDDYQLEQVLTNLKQ